MGLVTKLLGGWQGYAAIAVLCFLAGSAGTWRVMSWREAAAVTHQAQQTVRLVEHQANITFNVSMSFEAARITDQAATDKLLDEVEVHVTPAIDIAHPVPCGFVRMWDAAAHQPIPDAACQPDDARSGVALSEVARATVENDGQYDIIAHQLTALQTWITEQSKAK